jgi:hypothetical protein
LVDGSRVEIENNSAANVQENFEVTVPQSPVLDNYNDDMEVPYAPAAEAPTQYPEIPFFSMPAPLNLMDTLASIALQADVPKNPWMSPQTDWINMFNNTSYTPYGAHNQNHLAIQILNPNLGEKTLMQVTHDYDHV